MYQYRYIFLLILLLISSSITYANPAVPIQVSDKELNSQISEDVQTLSPCHLAANVVFFKDRIDYNFPAAIIVENYREYSREIAYFFANRFIDPGLSLPDIIFPFHTFL